MASQGSGTAGPTQPRYRSRRHRALETRLPEREKVDEDVQRGASGRTSFPFPRFEMRGGLGF